MQHNAPSEEAILELISDLVLSDGCPVARIASRVVIKQDKIGFYLSSQEHNSEELDKKRHQIEKILKKYYPDYNITIAIHGAPAAGTGKKNSTASAARPPGEKKTQHPNSAKSGVSSKSSNSNSYSTNEEDNKYNINNVSKIIAISSGKGGVGKSTTALNLAAALKQQKYKVGVADLDIHGPSIPNMLGAEEHPEVENEKFMPLIRQGIKTISMGNLLKKNQALPWRGPMSIKAMHQLLLSTDWGGLDYLLVDMPPGTSDVHMSFAGNYHIYGALLVTTPQKASVEDVQKNIIMLEKYNTHVLGVVENMSGYESPQTGEIMELFGSGGGKRLAELNKLKLIEQIPIYMDFTYYSELGEIAVDKNKKIRDKFYRIVEGIKEKD